MPNELPGAGLGSSGIGGSSDGANGDFMSIIGALKTEEMIALACGGAGFLLFIVVIIVIIIRFKKKQQKTNFNKTHHCTLTTYLASLELGDCLLQRDVVIL